MTHISQSMTNIACILFHVVISYDHFVAIVWHCGSSTTLWTLDGATLCPSGAIHSESCSQGGLGDFLHQLGFFLHPQL